MGFAYQGPYVVEEKNGGIEIEAQLLSGLVELSHRIGAEPIVKQRYSIDLLDIGQINLREKVDISLRFKSPDDAQRQKVTFKWHVGKPYELTFDIEMSHMKPIGYWPSL